MKENSTYFFVLDNVSNDEVLFQPLKMEKEFKNVSESLPLYSPKEESVERLMKMIENMDM